MVFVFTVIIIANIIVVFRLLSNINCKWVENFRFLLFYGENLRKINRNVNVVRVAHTHTQNGDHLHSYTAR